MSDYVIFTDDSCDISPQILHEWDVRYLELSYLFDGEDTVGHSSNTDYPTFYNRMRQGAVARTSAVNVEAFLEHFRSILEEGKDVLYIGFSSGLSTTCASGETAAREIAAEYPDRKIIVVDSLAASSGFGLLVYLTVLKKREGASIEEAAQFVRDTRLNICHWFTVEDLVYLKRGGRVSAAAAFAAGILGIKPVLHVDDEGHLINIMKVRGRKMSLRAMADKYGELALNPGKDTIFISHGDCREDAETLAGMLKERYGAKVQLIEYVGPVIGAHSGPGTLALFFVGSHR